MFLDLRKMGVSESVMFKDFAGFRTLDSVVRASKVFQVPSFTIISQKFHCERALLIAKHYDIDAICFTAGIGENSFFARKGICDLLKDALGIELDEDANVNGQGDRLISTPNSKVKVFVIPTNEELVIARDTKRLLNL